MFAALLPAEGFAVFLVFARIGTAMMLLPGFGEVYVSTRIRLALALAITAVLAPQVAHDLPGLPGSPITLLVVLLGEAAVGFLIGGVARLTMSALQVAGTVIAFQSSLAYAQTVDPNQGTQGALVSALLSVLGVILVFASDLHHLLLRALHDSYVLFPAGELPPVGGFAAIATELVAGSFQIGLQMSAPFIAYGLVFYTGLGLLARLMPQFQFFFIAMPLQIVTAFVVLMITLPAMMLWFMTHYEEAISQLLAVQ